MTLFDKMRRAFGFSSSEEEETGIFSDDTGPAAAESSALTDRPEPADTADTPPTLSDASAPSGPSTDDNVSAVAEAMLAEVVALFNSFQPEFIARCLDADRQRCLLAESLTPALRNSLAEIIDGEKQRLSQAAEKERASLDSRLKQLTERNVELERRRNEFKDEQLSASRQKRALKERVADLESQIERLEGEKEQLELENRSMVNRLRAASVMESAAMPPVQAVAEESGKAPEATETVQQSEQPDNEALETLRSELETAKAEAAALTQKLSAELEAAKAEAAALTEKLSAAHAEISDLNGKLATTAADRDEYQRQVATLQEIAEHAEKFADVLEKRDARIAELKSRLKDTENDRKEIDRLAAENRSLRSTIEANLYEHATEMSALRRQMEENKPRRGRPRKQRPEPEDSISSEPDTPDAAPAPTKAPKTRHSRITAIDEFIESNEWLMAPSPEELASKVEEPSADFGYQAPAHKTTIHDDDKQLTLF